MSKSDREDWAKVTAPKFSVGEWASIPWNAGDGAEMDALIAYRCKVFNSLTQNDVGMMAHAVDYEPVTPWRNRYVVGRDTPDAARWRELIRMGLAEEGKPINDGSDAVFRLTEWGRAVTMLWSAI